MSSSAPPSPADTGPADLFDRTRRAIRRTRPVISGDIIGATIGDMLMERLDDVTRVFSRALIIGGRDRQLIAAVRTRCTAVDIVEANAALAAQLGAICCDEDRLAVDPGAYDLIIWPGGLDSVNDVPGALLRCRLALQPDGLMIAAFVGADSLPVLRQALRDGRALIAPERAVARANPQIDVRAAGDLLVRAGFALPVADVDTLTLRYRNPQALVADVRAAALTALMAGPVPALTRTEWAAVCAQLDRCAGGDGRIDERVHIVHLSGWAPDPSQPKAAARGSGKTSLAAALRPRD